MDGIGFFGNLARARATAVFYLALFCFFIVFVLASTPVWQGSNVNYTTIEDSAYYHDLSLNISGYNNDVEFAIDTQTDIVWTNASGKFNVTKNDVPWIKILNSSTGNLSINATFDNQTGFFEVPIQATNTTDNEFSGTYFEFMVNASNDAPKIINLNLEYNLTKDQPFSEYLNGSDEENHFPLSFNLSFIANCTHASWSNRNPGENCSLFNLSSVSDTSSLMNYTPARDDVGTYWAYVSVSDNGENFSCPHNFCDNSTYKVNKTSQPKVVKFNVFSSLDINVSDCNDRNSTEGVFFSCIVNITTVGSDDMLNISTYASFGNGYGGPISNRSWFYPNSTTNASNFSKSVNVSFTPGKREVGNWSIDFNVLDVSSNTSGSKKIYLFVNWTESSVSMDPISDKKIYENETFTVNAYDDDLLIQDKQTKSESLTFASNTSWVTIRSTETISGNNYTTATVDINFDAVKSFGDKNYSVKINVTETGGSSSERIFTIEVVNDTAASWNQSKNYNLSYDEGENILINLSEYVSDIDGDNLTYSYSANESFPSFSLNETTGIINFSTDDADVGFHELTINASDGKLDSFQNFNFTINNVVDAPVIEDIAPTINAAEDSFKQINLNVYDNDFLIPDSQKSYYNESLTVNVTFENLTVVKTKISFTFNFSSRNLNLSAYVANFTPTADNVGEYNVSINVSDNGSSFDIESFILNVTSVNDAPKIINFSNQSATVGSVFYLDVNATDEEDSPSLPENGNLTFKLENLTVGGDFLTINSTTGEINLSVNSSHIGSWEYNLSVNDTLGASSFLVWKLEVFGSPNVTWPASDYVFNFTEGVSYNNLNFTIDYGVNNTNLSYFFYMDKIYYFNSTNFNYTNLSSNSSLRKSGNFTWNSSANLTWNFTPDYTDETYGNLKNLTLLVYNPNYPALSYSIKWKVNISHKNQNVSFKGTNISDVGPLSAGASTDINLSNYFEDADYFDKNISQTVNFTINTVSGSGFVAAASSFNGWILTITSPTKTSEIVKVVANEYDDNDSLIGNASSNNFAVNFTEATSSSSSSSSGGGGGGGTRTKLQYFSIKLIVPDDIVFVDREIIEIGFSVVNDGQVDLSGINLSSSVKFNNKFTEDVKINLGEDYIPLLKVGEKKDFKMSILADLEKSGRYKATIFANVTSPKFSDSGDFFIEIRKSNDSELSQLLIFVDKIVSENPVCLELVESLNRARVLFDEGNLNESRELAQATLRSCEDAISKNEQIRYPLKFAQDNFYVISFTTLIIFFIGFIIYIYKRVKLNKYSADVLEKRR